MLTKDSVNKVYQPLHSSSLFKVDESAPGEPPILSVVEDNLADSSQEVEDNSHGNSNYTIGKFFNIFIFFYINESHYLSDIPIMKGSQVFCKFICIL